jgi:hypothetical protein
MKRTYFYVLMALSIVPNLSLAQGANIDAEVDQELDQMYATKQAGANVAPTAPTAVTSTPVARTSSQPIYILNQATPTSNASAQNTSAQVQKQPVNVIESTPLVESKAELMRKSRQDAEIQTEQKIVEKLESSRLEDEKRRADALFGNKLNQVPAPQQNESAQVIVNTPAPQPTPAAPVTAVIVATPAPTPAPVPVEPKEDTRAIIREELTSAMKVEKEEEPAVNESRYFSGIVGIGDYPDVTNVRGNYSVGAAFGTKYDYLIVEGSFLLSNYTIEQRTSIYTPYNSTIDGNQYQAAVAAKYQLMSGLVRPVIGGLASYSYRKFNWSTPSYGGYYGGGYYTGPTTTDSDSHAIDLGVSAGVDLEFNKKFALGFEYRYMFNLGSRVSGNQSITTGPLYGTGTPIEKLSYYTLGLAAKVNF